MRAFIGRDARNGIPAGTVGKSRNRSRTATFIGAALAAVVGGTIVVSGAFATGTTYYVATTGSNSNDCLSAGAPCLTIAGAIGKASSGDTIQVAAGNYSGTWSYGLGGKNLTFRGAQADVDARTRGGRAGAGTSSDQETNITETGRILTLGSETVTVDGFRFTDARARAFDNGGVSTNGFTVKNSIILSGATGGNNNGVFQFASGASYTAHDFTFDRNYVGNTTTSANAPIVYITNTADRGQITNNFINVNNFEFGPFGQRTGWRVEGNELDGRVLGVTQSPNGDRVGYGFNGNLGDVSIKNNKATHMYLGLGQISVVGGSIEGNTFDDNYGSSFQLWGGEYSTVVSGNVQVKNNLIKYNGTDYSSDSAGYLSQGFRIRPGDPASSGPDSSTIHVNNNKFIDLQGSSGKTQVWAVRNNGLGTLDAENNVWMRGGSAITDGTVISGLIGKAGTDLGDGLGDPKPWILSYTDDPDKAGQPGFWPTSIVSGETLSNSAVPTLSGTARVGQTLSTTDGTWSGSPAPSSYSYKWQRSSDGSTGWADISGATSSSYALTSADLNKYVRSVVTATNAGGGVSAQSASSSQIGAPMTVYVSASGSDTANTGTSDSSPFRTIQKGVNTVAAGGTVNVAAGTYTENVSVTGKGVTIRGAGYDSDPVSGGRSSGESKLVTANAGAWSLINTDSSGLTVEGMELADGYNSISVSPSAAVSGFNVRRNWIHTNQIWRGIVLNNNTSQNISNVTIDRNLITSSASYQNKSASALLGFSGAVTYSNIQITDNTMTTITSGRWLFGPSVVLVDGMTVSGNTTTGGSYNMGNVKNGKFSGNQFNTSGKGLYIGLDNSACSGATCGFVGNTFASGMYLEFWGGQFPSKSVAIANNLFGSGSELYLDVGDPVGTPWAPYTTDVASFTVTNNSFATPAGAKDCTADSNVLISGPGSGTLNASGNWWGASTGAPSNFCGFASVTTSPWIASYTDDPDKSGQPGFWPTSVTSYELPANSVLPALSGTARVGQTLSTTDGTWSGSPAPSSYSYKWQRSSDGSTGWADISGATSSSYALTSADLNNYVRSVVTANSDAGSVSAQSASSSQIGAPLNVYVSTSGDDTNNAGTSSDSPVRTITKGISLVAVGGTVNVAAGTYNEAVTLNKLATVQGAGSSTVIDANGAGLAVTLNAPGGSVSNHAVLKDFKITNFTNDGVQVQTSNLTIDGVTVTGNGISGTSNAPPQGIRLLSVSDIEIKNSTTEKVNSGLRIPSANSVSKLRVTGSTFKDANFGIYADSAKASLPTLDDVQITDSTISNNRQKGIYLERLSNATISGVTFSNNGNAAGPATALNLNLKYGTYSNIKVQNNTFTGNSTNAAVRTSNYGGGEAIAITARNDAPSYSTPPIGSLSDLEVSGNTIADSPVSLRIENNVNVSSATVTNNKFDSFGSGTYDGGLLLNVSGPAVSGSLTASANSFPANGRGVSAWAGSVNAAGSWWGQGTGASGSQTAGSVTTTPWIASYTADPDKAGQPGFWPTDITGGSAPANSAAPTISGTAAVGSSLTSTAGTWSGSPTPDLAYKWQRSSDGSTGWADIDGATSSSYELNSADADKFVRAVVTGSNTYGSVSSQSSASSRVTQVPANSVAPAVTGTVRVGETLATDTGTWVGAPTPTFSYKWQKSNDGSSGWTDISGATSSSYALTAADSGTYVRSVVTATNSTGSSSKESSASSQVAAPNTVFVAPSGDNDTATATTSSSPVRTIARAIGLVAAGGTVNVLEGTYSEDVTVSKRVTIKGSGSGTKAIVGTAGGSAAVSITASGGSSSSKVDVQDLSITAASGKPAVSVAASWVDISGVSLDGPGSVGIDVPDSSVGNVTVRNVAFSSFATAGVQFAGSGSLRVLLNSFPASDAGVSATNGTVDARDNWWNTGGVRASGAQASAASPGTVDTSRWIRSYTADPAKSGQAGFWPTGTVTQSPPPPEVLAANPDETRPVVEQHTEQSTTTPVPVAVPEPELQSPVIVQQPVTSETPTVPVDTPVKIVVEPAVVPSSSTFSASGSPDTGSKFIDIAFHDVATDTKVNPDGPFTVCLVAAGPSDRLWHYEDGNWVDITNRDLSNGGASWTSRDTSGGRICGQVSHFSPFGVAPDTYAAPPTVALQPPLVSPTNTASPKIDLGGETGATFTYTLDGGDPTDTLLTELDLSGLAEGDHTLVVYQTDVAGNVSDTTTYAFEVDTVAPDAPGLELFTPSGATASVADTGTATTETSARVVFSSNDPDTVTYQCSVNGATATDCESPFSTGLSGLADGLYTVAVTQTDQAGNVSDPSTVSWTVDNTAPGDVTLTTPSGAGSWDDSTTFRSSDSETFKWTLPGNPAPASSISTVCSLDGGPDEDCDGVAGSGATFDNLAEGRHELTIKVVDAAGNASSGKTISWITDTVAPEPPSLSSNRSGYTKLTGATLTFSGEAGATFSCQYDSVPEATCSSPMTVSGLDEGTLAFSVTQTDKAGNVSAPATVSWKVDHTAPDLSGLASSRSDATNWRSATFTWDVADGVSADADIRSECKLTKAGIGGAWNACSSGIELKNLPYGAMKFEVRLVDQAGNVSPADSVEWTINKLSVAAPPSLDSSSKDDLPMSTKVTATDPEWSGEGEANSDAISWQRCSSSLASSCTTVIKSGTIATAGIDNYTPVAADLNKRVRYVVTRTTDDGSTLTTASNLSGLVVPKVKTATTIAGLTDAFDGSVAPVPAYNRTLTSNDVEWTTASADGIALLPLANRTTLYRWQRCTDSPTDPNENVCKSISGATANTYKPTSSDIGRNLRLLTGVCLSGACTPSSSTSKFVWSASAVTQAVRVVADNTVAPTLVLRSPLTAPKRLKSMSVKAGSWRYTLGGGTSYLWQRCTSSSTSSCSGISGATKSSYTPSSSDVGNRLRARVRYTGRDGTAVTVYTDLSDVTAS